LTKPETFGQRFGKLVKARRLAKGWGQARLAYEAWGNGNRNFSGENLRAHIVRIEKGAAANPHAETVFALQMALGISSAEIAELRGEQPAGDPVFVAALLERNAGLAKDLQLKDQLVIGLARGVATDVADFDTALHELARALTLAAQMRDQAALPSNTGDQVTEVLRQLSTLNDQNRLDEGADLLAAELARLDAQKARLYDAAIDQDILRRNAPSAARWLVERLKSENPYDLFDAIRASFLEWYVQGHNSALSFETAVAVHLAQAAQSHAIGPDRRGTALNDLANALLTLGQLEAGTARLEQAVETYSAALMEYTQDLVPLDWAKTQMNLGSALQTLGQRETGTERLEQAVEAYRAALTEVTQDRVPLDWAKTQMNLGTALAALGQREAGTARLEQAVDAFRAALTEPKQDQVLLEEIAASSNTANLLKKIGYGDIWRARVDQAHAADRTALTERSKERVRIDWATTQMNLGNTLLMLGEQEARTARLEQAVDAFRAALTEYRQDRVPLYWAMTQMSLGTALAILGEREAGTARLEQAVEAYRAALTEVTQDRVPLQWANTQMNLGTALATLGEREAGTARLEQAVEAYRAALTEYRQDRVPLDWAITQSSLGSALAALGRREAGTARLDQAVTAFRSALTELTQDQGPLDWANTLGEEGMALLTLADRTGEAARARQALEQLTLAEATLRSGGHIPWADSIARQIPAAQALVDRLSGGQP
jgi:exonuclease VII small subunit